jgi:hypothetical protein
VREGSQVRTTVTAKCRDFTRKMRDFMTGTVGSWPVGPPIKNIFCCLFSVF